MLHSILFFISGLSLGAVLTAMDLNDRDYVIRWAVMMVFTFLLGMLILMTK